MAEPKTIREAWDGYRRDVLVHFKLSAEQIASARHLFYAGAMVGFTLAMELPELSDAEAAERMATIESELRAHGEELGARLVLAEAQCPGPTN